MFITKTINLYRKFISPLIIQLLGPSFGCRFYPTCSEYSHQAILKFGLLRGGAKSFGRIARCNPLFQGGVDEIKVN